MKDEQTTPNSNDDAFIHSPSPGVYSGRESPSKPRSKFALFVYIALLLTILTFCLMLFMAMNMGPAGIGPAFLAIGLIPLMIVLFITSFVLAIKKSSKKNMASNSSRRAHFLPLLICALILSGFAYFFISSTTR